MNFWDYVAILSGLGCAVILLGETIACFVNDSGILITCNDYNEIYMDFVIFGTAVILGIWRSVNALRRKAKND